LERRHACIPFPYTTPFRSLEQPTRSIPVGSLSAILSSYALHLLFIVGLGVTCTRVALLQDYSIAQHVSALGLFFMFGLYMSTLRSEEHTSELQSRENLVCR